MSESTSVERGTEVAPPVAPACPEWLPDWIRHLGAAVWVCDPKQRLAFANERAEAFLEGGPQAIGRSCFESIAGRGADGRVLCRPDCEHRRRALAGQALVPAVWRQVRARDGWVLLVPIPLVAPDGSGTWIVHVAQELEEMGRTRSWVERIAGRSRLSGADVGGAGLAALTLREREILGLLSLDQDPAAIARRLFLSPVTVRNHVQHMLGKLGAHSVQEAVALQLLYGADDEPRSAS